MLRGLAWAVFAFALLFVTLLSFRLLFNRVGASGSALERVDVAELSRGTGALARPREQPTQFGTFVVRNRSTSEVTLDQAFIIREDANLRIAGFAVLDPRENDSWLAGQCGPFPPPNFATHRVAGYRVAPGDSVAIIVAVSATGPGVARLDGMRLSYRTPQGARHQDFAFVAELRASFDNPSCSFDATPHQKLSGTGGV